MILLVIFLSNLIYLKPGLRHFETRSQEFIVLLQFLYQYWVTRHLVKVRKLSEKGEQGNKTLIIICCIDSCLILFFLTRDLIVSLRTVIS